MRDATVCGKRNAADVAIFRATKACSFWSVLLAVTFQDHRQRRVEYGPLEQRGIC